MGGRLSRWSPLAEWIVAPIGIACAFAITRGQALHGGRIFAAFQDTTYLVLPLFNYISGGMMHGQYPYWINTIVGGIPLYNNPQFSTLYPFYFFHWGLYGNALDALINLQKVTVLHLLIAYLNCYVFLRIVGLGRLPAFVGASIFGLSAEVMRYSTWVMIIAAYAWFPLALAAVLLILQRRHPKAGILIGVFACSMMALACPAQPLIHTLYACAVIYGFYVVLCLKSRQYEAVLGATKDLGLMVCIAAVITSPVLVPIAMSSQEYIRWVGHGSNVIGHQRIPFADFTSMQSDVSALAGTMVPARVSNIGSPFIGMGATFLAVLSIFRARGNWILYPLWFIAIYALASATGAHLGLAFINYHLPLLNEIREPGRHLFLFIFAASALAAFGFAYLSELAAEGLKAVSTRKHLVVAIVFLVMLTASLLVDLRYLGHVTRLFLLAIFALSVIVIVLAFLVRSWHRSALLVAIAALVVYGSLQYPWRARPLNQSEYFTPANLASENALNQASSLDPKRDYRWLFSDDALNSEYWSMNASYYGLRSFQGYMNPLPYRQFDEVFDRFGVRHYYPLLGAKYYLCSPCDKSVLRDYRFERKINGFSLYTSSAALPRLAVLGSVAGNYDNADDFYAAIARGFDFHKAVYVQRSDFAAVQGWLNAHSSSGLYRLNAQINSPNEVRATVKTRYRALLLLNEYYRPDWKASVNGTPVHTFRVNLNQIGVLLNPGNNLIDLQFEPTLYIALIWLQRVAILLLFGYVTYYWLSTRRHIGRVRKWLQANASR